MATATYKDQIWTTIRNECDARGFNRSDLAALMHTTPGNITRIDKHGGMVTVDHLIHLADAWGMTLDELVNREVPEATHPVKEKGWRKKQEPVPAAPLAAI